MPTSLETQFAELLRQQNVVAPESLQQALREVDGIRSRGAVADLLTVLVGRRLVRRDTVEKLLTRIPGVVLRCPACAKEFANQHYDPAAEAVCPTDGTPLTPTLAPRGLQASAGAGTSRPVSAPAPAPPASPARRGTGPAAALTGPAGSQPVLNTPRPGSSATLGAIAGVTSKEAQLLSQLSGKRLGSFQLHEAIAKGTKALIFRAQIPGMPEEYAVKVLVEHNETARKRFLREAKLAMRIDHPNVVRVFEVGSVENILFIAMEYVPGLTLLKMIDGRKGPMPVREALSIALPVLDGLSAAHKAGIIHRDLKPSNIVVGEVDVKILDFGLARVQDPETSDLSRLTESGTTLGTPYYMAPEQVSSPVVDRMADLYAFGATLYHALTGQPPFPGTKTFDVLMAKMSKDPAPPSTYNKECSKALDTVLLKLLARNPKDRFQSAEDTAVALRGTV